MWKISTSILAKRYAFVCLLCYHITATWAIVDIAGNAPVLPGFNGTLLLS